jgi:hypothetical protein
MKSSAQQGTANDVEMLPAFCYPTTTGRRSGRPHTIEIWFAAVDGSPVLMSGAKVSLGIMTTDDDQGSDASFDGPARESATQARR